MKRSPKIDPYKIYESFMKRSIPRGNINYPGYLLFAHIFCTKEDYYNYSKTFIDRFNRRICKNTKS